MAGNPAATPDTGIPSPMQEKQRLLLEKEVNSLQGWEPEWYIASMRFFRCSVASHLTRTMSGWDYSLDLKIERDGDAERGWERITGQPVREWFRKYPDVWTRIGGGEWTKGTVGPPSITFPGNYTLLTAYGAVPLWARKIGAGPVTYGFSIDPSGSTLEIEADNPGGLVRRIRRLDAVGRREWEEERTLEIRDGKAVLLSRTRRMYLPGAGEFRETCKWETGTGAVFTPPMVPPR